MDLVLLSSVVQISNLGFWYLVQFGTVQDLVFVC
jgi:hypothetical protein